MSTKKKDSQLQVESQCNHHIISFYIKYKNVEPINYD